MEIVEHLQSVPGFQCCDAQTIKLIAEQGETRAYKPGESIIREGESGQDLHFLLEGKVRVSKKSGDKDLLLVELSPGNFFGEVGVVSFNPSPSMATVVALEPVQTFVLTRDAADRILHAHPESAAMLFRVLGVILSEKLRKLDQAFVDLCSRENESVRTSELQRLQEKLYKEWGL